MYKINFYLLLFYLDKTFIVTELACVLILIRKRCSLTSFFFLLFFRNKKKAIPINIKKKLYKKPRPQSAYSVKNKACPTPSRPWIFMHTKMKIFQQKFQTTNFAFCEIWCYHEKLFKWPPFASKEHWTRHFTIQNVAANT